MYVCISMHENKEELEEKGVEEAEGGEEETKGIEDKTMERGRW